MTTLSKHYKATVQTLANHIKNSHQLMTTNRIKGHTFRDLNFKKTQDQLDTSCFNDIYKITDNTISCGSAVSMSKLHSYTIPRNRIICSVPEGGCFTVGGCVAGLALGSSSYKYGFFADNVIDFDLILGDGTILYQVSKDSHPDLFYGIGGTYGTMGIITRVTIRLIPCQSHVKLTYHYYENFHSFYSAMKERLHQKQDDFIEAIINNENNYVIMTAVFTDTTEKDYILDLNHDNFFQSRKQCLYAQIANRKQYHYLRLEQYLQRWSNDGWWMKYLYSPYKLKDYVLSFLMSLVMKKSFQTTQDNLFNLIESRLGSYERDKYFLISDIGVPLSKLEEGLALVDKYTGIYPLWLCPILDQSHPNKIFWTRDLTRCNDEIIFDLGIYGYNRRSYDSKFINEKFETYSFEKGLLKGFFSTSYFKRTDFWSRFDRNQYLNLRKKYNASTHFMDLYDKIIYKQQSSSQPLSLQAKLIIKIGLQLLIEIKKNESFLIKNKPKT